MLTEFQAHKLTHMFHHLDSDGNGLIERQDYEQVLATCGELYGYAPGSAEFQQLSDAYLGQWEGLRQIADKDHDCVITVEEFLAAFDGLLAQKEPFMANLRAINNYWYSLADRDGDGFFNQEELMFNHRSINVGEEESRLAFPHLDRSGHGLISQEDMILNLEEYYYSDDPAAAGNWAMGPLHND